MMTYLIFMAPAMILAGLASLYTHLTFKKYSKVSASSGLSGSEAARQLLTAQGISDVTIERADGFLSDHYDPTKKALRLSPGVYDSDSLSAIGVACHEAGHAIQHAAGYGPLGLRSALVPVTQFGSIGSYIFFMLGMILQHLVLFKVGILLFTIVVIFSIITLPVEWNASMRARQLMTTVGIVTREEESLAAKVLKAAFLTYVASAFSSMMQLLYYLIQAGLLGGRRD